jgi:hypothetical protein
MRLLDLCLIGAHAQPGEPSVRLGVPRARTVMEDGRRFLGFRHLSPGRVLRRKRQVPSETGNLTTDRDGPVMDCYGFRSLGPVRDPPADGAQTRLLAGLERIGENYLFPAARRLAAASYSLRGLRRAASHGAPG